MDFAANVDAAKVNTDLATRGSNAPPFPFVMSIIEEKRLAFGLQPAWGTKLAWGARLIWNGLDEPDLVFDRQTLYAAEGIDDAAKTEMCELADGTIKVEWRTEELKKLRVRPNNATEASGEMKHGEHTYTWRACAKSSYGYLYVVIERVEKEEEVEPQETSFTGGWSATEALQAIRARIDGVWDDIELLKLGPLDTDTEADIIRILDAVAK